MSQPRRRRDQSKHHSARRAFVGVNIGVDQLSSRSKGMDGLRLLQPPNWVRPKGYSNGVAAKGRTIFLSGMVGWNSQGEFVARDLTGQVRQALDNVVEVLNQAQAKPEHIVRMVWYVVDKREYLGASKEIGMAYRDVMGRHYPAMTVVEVSGLLEAHARVEIEVTAVAPE
jgi:enamine deaminase RidA (YjgF/YER057c/UK114 family)